MDGPEAARDPWRVAEAESALASGSGRKAIGAGGDSRGGDKGAGTAADHDPELPAVAEGLHLYPELELQVEPESEVEEDEASDPQVQR